MKIPTWLMGIITAAILGCFTWIFKANADIATIKTTNELRREQMIESAEVIRADISELKQMLSENRDQHDKIFRMLERLNRR